MALRKLTRSQRFEVARAKEIVASGYDIGVRDSITGAPIERVIKSGYAILHGMQMGREDRIALLEALAVLERAGDYQPEG